MNEFPWGDDREEGQGPFNDEYEEEEDENDGEFVPDQLEHSNEETASPGPDRSSAPVMAPSRYQGLIQTGNEWYTKLTERIDQERLELVRAGVVSDGPPDSASERMYIKGLFDAIVNTLGVVDRETKGNKPAQAVQRFLNNYYTDEAIEMVCWEILMKCRDCQYGISMVDPHYRSLVEEYPSFHDRMKAITRACRKSKALCKSLLDPRFIDRLVDGPVAELSRKEANNTINAHRNEQNAFGRKAMARKLALADLDKIPPGSATENENQTFVTPKKTRRISQAGSTGAKPRSSKRKLETKSRLGDAAEEENPTPAKRSTRQKPTTTPSKPSTHPSTRKMMTTHNPKSGPPQAASSFAQFNDPGEDAINYRIILCDILQIDHSFATQFSLTQLRTYARAYNQQFARHAWTDDSQEQGSYGLRYNFYWPNGYRFDHFAHPIPLYLPIAKARGDLDEKDVWNRNSPNIAGFNTEGNFLYNQALGVIDNPYGLHSQLYTNFDA